MAERSTGAGFAHEVVGKNPVYRARWQVRLIRALVPIGLALLVISILLSFYLTALEKNTWPVGTSAVLSRDFGIALIENLRDGFQVVTYLVAAFTAALAVWQWLAARHEASFDKYYERLNLANSKFDTWSVSRMKEPPDPDPLQSHYHTMFVFSELDNLEYILEKRRLGYANMDLVGRAMRHFVERCRHEDFRKAAHYLVDIAGYQDTIKTVVKSLVSRADHVS